jgi:hypothetical protein
MNLDLAESLPREVGKTVEAFGVILLFGIEEAMLRRPAVGVPERVDTGGIRGMPAPDVLQGQVAVDAASKRFVVIAHGYDEVAGTRRGARPPRQ